MNIKNLGHADRRNPVLAVLIVGLSNASFILPIWLLFFTQQLGLSITAAIALSMTRWVTSAIAEVPTGSWADRFGRVKIYRIGAVGVAVSYLPFLFTDNLVILFASQIIGGFFGSMTSGVLSPLVHDSLAGLKTHRVLHKRYLSNSTTAMYLSRMLAGILGAWLFSKMPYAPYFMEFVMLFAAFLLSWGLREVRLEKSDAKSNRQHIGDALKVVTQNTYLATFFICVGVFTFMSEAVWTSFQPFFEFRQIDVQYFGLLFGLIALFSAVGSYLSRHIPESFDPINVRLLMSVGVVLGTIFMLVPSVWFAIIVSVVMGISFGFASPNTNYAIQTHVSSRYQSTVISLSSLLDLIIFASTSLLVGLWADLYGVGTLVKILFIQACIGLVIIYGLRIWLTKKMVSETAS